jgi:anti-sigma regulatory factor (Ser/Thr protein kinase)
VNDAITLTVPHARSYYGVVRLVVGGLAARLDLPYDSLEDLNVALESLLETDAYTKGDEVTVEVGLADGRLEVAIGPLDGTTLERALGNGADAHGGVGLGRLLATVAGGYEIERRDGGAWLRLRKELG